MEVEAVEAEEGEEEETHHHIEDEGLDDLHFPFSNATILLILLPVGNQRESG